MLKFNAESVFDNLIQDIKKAVPDDKKLASVSLTLLASIKRRVHNEGLMPNRAKIGAYSTKPLYISPKNSPKSFGGNIGKFGQSKFKNGKDHKTRYFKSGYKEFRGKIGRVNSKVNLHLFGDLERGFQYAPIGGRHYLGIISSQVKKYDGLTAKYGKFYGLSAQDHKDVARLLQ